MDNFVLNQYMAQGRATFKGPGKYAICGENSILSDADSVCRLYFHPRVRSAGATINITLHVGTKQIKKVNGGTDDLVQPMLNKVKWALDGIPNADIKAFGYGVSSGVSGQPQGDDETRRGAENRIRHTADVVQKILDGEEVSVPITGGNSEDIKARMAVTDVHLFLGMESGARQDSYGRWYDFSYNVLTDQTYIIGDMRRRVWVMRTRGVEMHTPALLEARERNEARSIGGVFDGTEPNNTQGNVGKAWGLWKSDSDWQEELSPDGSSRFKFPAEVYGILLQNIAYYGVIDIFTRFRSQGV